MSNDTWMPAVPLPASATACSTIEAMPWRSMSFIVKTCTLRVADGDLLALVEVAHADEHGVRGQHLRRQAADLRELAPARVRAAPRAACRARCRSATSPACSCRRARRPTAGRSAARASASPTSAAAATEPGAEAVVAAEHERHRAFDQRLERGLVQLLADLRDVARCTSAGSSRGACVSGIGAGRSPLSATVKPSAAICSPARRSGTPTAPCRRRACPRRGRAGRR